MKKLTGKARLYILATLIVGGALLAHALLSSTIREGWLVAGACVLAALTQVLKVEGTTVRASYSISWMVFGFTFVLLGVQAAVIVVVVAHLIEWVRHRYPWYIQTFNIASYVISVMLAHRASEFVTTTLSHAPSDVVTAVTIIVSLAAFTWVNHLLVGVVIWLARGENFAKSGIFGLLTLMMDFALLCLGAAASLIWRVNPYAVILTVIPLYLLYSTLRLPALERQTDTDPKTGLFNAKYFTRALDKALAHASHTNLPLTVVVGDLDLLRNINNTYGHLAGDAVLVKIADILQQAARPVDVVSRFGGEEFAWLMPSMAPEVALVHVERIRALIQTTCVEVPTSVSPIGITMSFGIAGLERPGQLADEIIHNADVALYHSKLTGRNRVSIYSNASAEDLFSTARSKLVSSPSANVTPAATTAATTAPTTAAKERDKNTQPPDSPNSPSPNPSSGGARPKGDVKADARAEESRPATTPSAVRHPVWLLRVYIGGLALVALVAAAVMIAARGPALPNWVALGLFVLMVVLTEWFAVDIYVKDTSVSLATVPLVAGALLFGPWGALVLSVALAGTAKIKHGSQLSRFVFNAANHLICSLLCIGLLTLAAGVLDVRALLVVVILGTLATGVVYLASTVLLAMAIGLDTGLSAVKVWWERFSWLLPSYLVMGVFAGFLAYCYITFGLIAVVSMVLPLAILRLGQKQYIDRTKDNVSQLHATNAELRKQTREIMALNDELLLTLGRAFGLRDPYVHEHANRVARYSTLIAEELGLPEGNVERIRRAALLHDIGKLAIPDTILLKPGPLTADERDRVRQHVVLGADILSQSHSLQELIPAVRHHHERFDGMGYPDRLPGPEIPIEARIVGLADAAEAMSADRPYRRGMNPAMILQEVQTNAGSQFDPIVAEAFVRVLQREGESIIASPSRTMRMWDQSQELKAVKVTVGIA